MRKHLLSVCFLLASVAVGTTSNAQFISYLRTRLLVNSPSVIAGPKNHTISQENNGDANDWGAGVTVPYVNVPLVRAIDTLGCSGTITNSAQITGKFALIRRGTCQFSEKAYEAQQKGAIGVIIMNHTANTALVNMAGGTNATLVNIPVLFISKEDGDAIENQLLNSVAVNITLTPWGMNNNNDLALVPYFTAPYHAYAMPFSQLASGSPVPYRTYLHGYVANTGLTTQANVKLRQNITWTPTGGSATQVYADSASTGTFAPIDSVIELLSQNHTNLTANQTGKFDMTYTVSANNPDQYTIDNSVTHTMQVTDSVFSKGRLQDNGKIVISGATRFANSSEQIWGPLYYLQNGPRRAHKIQFSVDATDTALKTLDQLGQAPLVHIYRWNDAAPFDSVIQPNELLRVGIAGRTYTTADSLDRPVTLDITDPLIPNKGVKLEQGWYWIAIEVDGQTLISVDNGISYYSRSYGAFNSSPKVKEYFAPQFQGTETAMSTSTTSISMFPFTAVTANNDIDSVNQFTMRGLVPTAALHISKAIFTGVEDVRSSIEKFNMFPNPSNGVLNVDLKLNTPSSQVVLKITDVLGRTIQTVKFSNTASVQHVFNTALLAPGNYSVIMIADKESSARNFTVVK